jgi:hypothetical protein
VYLPKALDYILDSGFVGKLCRVWSCRSEIGVGVYLVKYGVNRVGDNGRMHRGRNTKTVSTVQTWNVRQFKYVVLLLLLLDANIGSS